ncbi:MAG TPA: carboxypeptidase-like regulatory domain-containing protein [Bryobacteraceae bacterium]|nr:carboxypeptidase-like regulatory domain-containing protein [Bryobacteraceae bacterium]
MYIDSITVKGGTYQKGVLQVEQGSQIELMIKASEGVGQIEGVAMRDGQPAAAAMVLAMPQDWSHGNYIPRDQPDSDGTFTLSSVPPGRYKVVAIEDGRGLAYANPDVIQPYLEKAALVTVTGTKRNVKLQVEVLPRY